MPARELAAIAFRTLAVWLVASGLAGLFSALLTWKPDAALYGPEATAWRLAAASIFVPVGSGLWLVAGALARRAFSSPATLDPWHLGRGDLYAFASLLVGMFLLTDALTQMVYWAVVWYTAQDTGFWEAASTGSMPNSVVYWVHVRAQVGLVLSKTVLGIALVLGPERLRAAAVWLRRELSSTLLEETPANAAPSEPPRDGA